MHDLINRSKLVVKNNFWRQRNLFCELSLKRENKIHSFAVISVIAKGAPWIGYKKGLSAVIKGCKRGLSIYLHNQNSFMAEMGEDSFEAKHKGCLQTFKDETFWMRSPWLIDATYHMKTPPSKPDLPSRREIERSGKCLEGRRVTMSLVPRVF